jgi:hypothetical protein
MAAISGFTYTIQKRRKIDASPSVNECKASLAFGDGSATYPTGGIPIAKASLGMPNFLESVDIVEMSSADGYIYKVDLANAKIKIFVSPAVASTPSSAVALSELANSATPQGTIAVIAKGY